MIALGSFLAFLGMIAIASFVGRWLRRARKQQTVRPPLYIVRDEPLDIKQAQERSRP